MSHIIQDAIPGSEVEKHRHKAKGAVSYDIITSLIQVVGRGKGSSPMALSKNW